MTVSHSDPANMEFFDFEQAAPICQLPNAERGTELGNLFAATSPSIDEAGFSSEEVRASNSSDDPSPNALSTTTTTVDDILGILAKPKFKIIHY